MPKTSAPRIDENTLTRGQVRKLAALRKSVGDGIADRAFAAWLSSQSPALGAESDESADIIVDTLWPFVQQGELAIPRGGYLIRRGRRRIIVEKARS